MLLPTSLVGSYTQPDWLIDKAKLAQLMTKFREVCYAAGIRPERWAGSGWLGAAIFKQHGALKRPMTAREQAEAAERKQQVIAVDATLPGASERGPRSRRRRGPGPYSQR